MTEDLKPISPAVFGPDLTRRGFLGAAIAAGAVSAAGGSAFAQAAKTIEWWDQFAPLVPLHQKIW